MHYSFFCGNQTVFNQLTLTCAFPEDAVPCQNARDFYYVNDNIGIEDALFLRDEDVARAQQKTHTGFKSFLSNFVRLPTNQFFSSSFCLSSLNCPPLEVEHPQEVLCSVPVSDPCICSHFLVFAK
ncbi:chitin-binding type-2 domain-containing protein [Caerostris darwini]|uniref:Chitin-binding type-2 domain-containing protein n=1 Tax=Caerostris darwini TaxID=1538125 RepID=A0AAV4PXY6_9ARAC|nr:chitin-binding type-2 domain-containing protein [Caerostris darwini]